MIECSWANPSSLVKPMPKTKSRPTNRTQSFALAPRKARGFGHERLLEILVAAKGLFLEHGFESVSTRKIAERVGISQTALFTHYRTKDEILAQLVRDAFKELDQAMSEIDSIVDDRDWLEQCIAGYINFGLSHPDEYRLAFMTIKAYRKPSNSDQPVIVGEGTRVGMPIFGRLTQRVDKALNNHVIRNDLGSSMLVAQTLWASIHGLVAILISRPRPHFPWEKVEDLVRTQSTMLLEGLLARRNSGKPRSILLKRPGPSRVPATARETRR